jgi:hypothetical protein
VAVPAACFTVPVSSPPVVVVLVCPGTSGVPAPFGVVIVASWSGLLDPPDTHRIDTYAASVEEIFSDRRPQLLITGHEEVPG